MGELVCRIQYRTQHGTDRRLLSDGEVCEMQEYNEEDQRWDPLDPGWIDEKDVALAVGALKPRLKQEIEIDNGFLEGVELPYKSPSFTKELKAWCRARRERGQKVTATVAERQMEKCRKWGEAAATEALANAADRGWAGLFFPHKNGKSEPTPSPNQEKNASRLRIHR